MARLKLFLAAKKNQIPFHFHHDDCCPATDPASSSL
jgi:hypothetical protein